MVYKELVLIVVFGGFVMADYIIPEYRVFSERDEYSMGTINDKQDLSHCHELAIPQKGHKSVSGISLFVTQCYQHARDCFRHFIGCINECHHGSRNEREVCEEEEKERRPDTPHYPEQQCHMRMGIRVLTCRGDCLKHEAQDENSSKPCLWFMEKNCAQDGKCPLRWYYDFYARWAKTQ